ALPAGSREEDELELADLQLVAVAQGRLGFDALPVQVRAVERPHVAEDVAVGPVDDLDVAAGHGYVVEEDVTVGMATGPRDVAVEHELRPRIRAPLHHG